MELLKVTHLHKEFGQNTVLNDINLSVEKGEVVVIIGPSGCGKSTFLRCLNGLEEIQGGVITISGLPVEAGKRDITKLRQKIGMVFQSYELFPHKTVLENIILAPTKVQKRDKEEATKEAIELLDKVGLVDKKDYYPRQLPEMVHEVLETMIALAKAGSTMLIVTHEMAFAKAIADRIIFIDKGDIVEETRDVKEFFIEPKTERAKKFLKTFAYE